MKKLFFLLIILCGISVQGFCQSINNELGIGLGKIIVPLDKHAVNERHNGFITKSILFNSNYRHQQYPILYFTKRMHKRWHFRLSAGLGKYNYGINDYEPYSLIYDPYPNRTLSDYNYTLTNLDLSFGLQFDVIKSNHFKIYSAFDMSSTNWHTKTAYEYRYFQTQQTETIKSSYSNWSSWQPTFLIGMNRTISKKFSAALEAGLTPFEVFPIYRLSINYHF